MITEMCSGFETGSFLRLRHFVHHATLALRVIHARRRMRDGRRPGKAVFGRKAPLSDAQLAARAWFRVDGVKFRA